MRLRIFLFFCFIYCQSNAQLFINELCSNNENVIVDEFGVSSDWIELYNSTNTDIDLSGYYLSDNLDEKLKWQFPSVTIEANSFVLVFASANDLCQSYCHTNFKLSSDGEYLILSSPIGDVIDIIDFPALDDNQSYGRNPDGNFNWGFYDMPTPNSSNNTSTVLDFSQPPSFSTQTHFKDAPIQLDLQCNEPSCVIRFTTDGKIPDENSSIYNNTITLDTTTTIRARVFSTTTLPSSIITKTYFVNQHHELPIMAMTTDPYHLWDTENGILIFGPNADPLWPHFGANFWNDTEIPMHIEYFKNEERVCHFDLGSKIHGGKDSRTKPMKSFRFLGKESFGDKRINYPFFENKPITNFKRLVLRNASGDYNYTHFRDAYLHRYFIDNDLDLDVLAHQPVVVYLNGVYYGVMNLREKVDRYYLENNYGVDIENIDLLEEDTLIVDGNYDDFTPKFEFIINSDLSNPNLFEEANSYIDVKNMADYFIAQTVVNNTDWPGNNLKFWRERKPDSKYRYILFDLDVGMARHGWTDADFNSLGGLLLPTTESKHVKIMLSFLKNETYRYYFINRYADLLNTVFREDEWKNETDITVAEIDNEMKLHFQRWTWPGYDVWQNDRLEGMYTFINDRRMYARHYIQDHFQLENEVLLELRTYPENAGTITINSITPKELPWDGYYYNGVPVELTINSNNGFTFSHWQSLNTILDKNSNTSISYNFEKDDQITAMFESENNNNTLNVFPNLVQDILNVEILLPEISDVEIFVFDTSGRKVLNFQNEIKNAGLHSMQLDINDLPKGFYILSAKINQEWKSKKVIKM